MVNFRASLEALETSVFVPKVRIRLEAGNFVIKTIDSYEELKTVLALRYDIFHREFRSGPMPATGWDVDEFDAICDHLVIIDQEKDRLVGTYRLISSSFANKFYSQTEFDLGTLLEAPGVKLELGRACIDKSYRSGMVMTLLWRGLAAYMREVKADYLFGCSSAKTTDPTEVASIQAYLRQGGDVSDEWGIHPLPKYQMPKTEGSVQPDPAKAAELVPSLLSSYLKAGAKVCGEPALDLEFECVDFFTVLRTDQLTRMFERKYQL
jgi:putative hemolysin